MQERDFGSSRDQDKLRLLVPSEVTKEDMARMSAFRMDNMGYAASAAYRVIEEADDILLNSVLARPHPNIDDVLDAAFAGTQYTLVAQKFLKIEDHIWNIERQTPIGKRYEQANEETKREIEAFIAVFRVLALREASRKGLKPDDPEKREAIDSVNYHLFAERLKRGDISIEELIDIMVKQELDNIGSTAPHYDYIRDPIRQGGERFKALYQAIQNPNNSEDTSR